VWRLEGVKKKTDHFDVRQGSLEVGGISSKGGGSRCSIEGVVQLGCGGGSDGSGGSYLLLEKVKEGGTERITFQEQTHRTIQRGGIQGVVGIWCERKRTTIRTKTQKKSYFEPNGDKEK